VVGCDFEVSNSTEEWRVKSLDDEHVFLAKFLSEISTNDIVYDIGTNIGIFSVHAAKKANKVYSFEPDPGFRKRLIRNIDLNMLNDKDIVIEWAVSDTQGIVTPYSDGESGSSPSLKKIGDRGEVEVKSNTIDDAISNDEIRTPNVIKIDIEGAEILALRGMKKLLESEESPRLIFIELHPVFLKDFDSTVDECKSIIEKAGYISEYSDVRDNQEHCIYRKNN
jgi:FkbM family methyltransferase